MAGIHNLSDVPPTAATGEYFEELLNQPDFRLEKIVSKGQASPPGFWYDQDRDEWVLLHRGSARLAYEDGREEILTAGDFLIIPSRCRHRVEWASDDAVWLALHFSKENPAA